MSLIGEEEQIARHDLRKNNRFYKTEKTIFRMDRDK